MTEHVVGLRSGDLMGTYYRFVNFTKKEFVELTGLQDGGSGESAVLRCSPALAWLLLWSNGDEYRGRWRPTKTVIHLPRSGQDSDIQIASDSVYDFSEIEEDFLNITPGLLQSMRREYLDASDSAEWRPRLHDVDLIQRVRSGGGFVLAPQCSAICACGWRVGPIVGHDREHVLERCVADHVNDD